MQQIEDCLGNMGHCPGEILARIGYQVLRPIADNYINLLMSQANGKWQSLDSSVIKKIDRFYSVDLRQVRYATHIDTIHGSAITIGNNIFFPDDLDLDDKDDLELMYHELEHVVQYSNRGGVEPFLTEYVLKSGGKILEKQSFDVHDLVDLEAAAISKARQVYEEAPVGWKFVLENSCHREISVAINYYTLSGSWRATGYWDINPGKTKTLSEDGKRLYSDNKIFYVYAEVPAGNYSWTGGTGGLEKKVEDDGREVNFRKVDLSGDAIGALTYDFKCPNLK
jgi:hypothetical protein